MKTTTSRGFSIVELLAAVCITGLLVAVAIPSVSQVRASREDITCVSNLRQIGLGIVQYANDNQGRLPGPLYSGQRPWWSGQVNGGHWTQLASYLEPYLALKRTRTKWNGDDVFVCPAFKRAVKNLGNAPVYRINIQVTMGEDKIVCMPFGYPNSLQPQLFQTDEDFAPMTITALTDIRDAEGRPARSTTWMLKDIDQEDMEPIVQDSEYFGALPASRAHGGHRNALFFDFHMARVDIDSQEKKL